VRCKLCFKSTGAETQTPDSTPVVISTPEPEKLRETVKVKVGQLNLRAEGTTKSRIITVLKKGETLTVLTRENHWVKVQTDSGEQGWVVERYITAGEKTSSITGPAQQTPSSPVQVPESTPAAASKASLSPPASSNSLKINLNPWSYERKR